MSGLKSFFPFLISFVFLYQNFLFAENLFVRNLLGTQLEIGLNQRSNIGEYRDGTAGNALSMQQEVLSQDQFDLISELDRAKTEEERLQIIEQYIVSLNNSISNGKNLGDYEQTQVDYYNKIIKECEAPIKSKNSEFSKAVKNYNYDRAESVAEEIAELRACVARNEVYLKAHESYASSSKTLNSLQKKADYLSKNKEKIAKYYDILKPDLLKELLDISKTVESSF